MSDSIPRKVVTKYEGYGLVGGFALGLLLGVMVSCPHVREWPAWQSLSVILGGAGLGSLIGYLALAYRDGFSSWRRSWWEHWQR
jgi:hypothetical protein